MRKVLAERRSTAYVGTVSERRASYLAAPRQRRRGGNGRRLPSAVEAGFPGCEAVPMSADELDEDDRRIEYWDAEDGVAWTVCEPTSLVHERPTQRLVALLDRIAQVRGADIECGGATTFYERGPKGQHIRAMEADQTVYLDAPRALALPPQIVVLGNDAPPDVVLEVDHTTDVRRRKLAEYQRWRFTEVWVEVPEGKPGSRSRRRPGFAIHVLNAESGCYGEAAESTALAGWKADEIHLALNEPTRSPSTRAAVMRVGRALGDRDGTQPTQDPLLRGLLQESRRKARQEGRQEGWAQATAASMQRILAQRGIACAPGLFDDGRLLRGHAAADTAAIVDAALACGSEEDLLAALAAIRARPRRRR